MNYKDKLKYLREEKEVTQEDVAKALNISRSSYKDYEAQISIIPIKHLDNLCNYFDISLDYALSFRNYPNTNKKIDKIEAGNRLKSFRQEEKLSREKLGNILNTSFATISFYERGRNLISTPFLYTICSKYNISADYLLSRTDNPKYLKKKIKTKKYSTTLNYSEKLKNLREYNTNNKFFKYCPTNICQL